MFSISLDWLSFTVERSAESDLLINSLAPGASVHPIAARFGYTWGRQAENGVVVFGHDSRDGMGTHVIISGSALRSFEDSGLPARSILAQVIQARGKVTRLDLAKDAQNESINIGDIEKAAIDGKRRGRAQSCASIRNDRGGYTLYIGSRSSERFARIYDKAAQTATVGQWIRYEFELKGDVARSMAGALSQNGVDWNGVFGAMAKDFFEVDAGNYSLFLEGSAVEGLPKIEKSSDREKWLLLQVIPAIQDHLAKHPDSAAIQALFYTLRPYFEDNLDGLKD